MAKRKNEKWAAVELHFSLQGFSATFVGQYDKGVGDFLRLERGREVAIVEHFPDPGRKVEINYCGPDWKTGDSVIKDRCEDDEPSIIASIERMEAEWKRTRSSRN